MKILVTGHRGYLGSHFVSKYQSDYEIIGYDLVEGNDILNIENLRSKMADCDQVVHLAAIPKPVEGKSFDEYFRINIEGTKNIAKVAHDLGLKRIIYASSTTIYGIEGGIPFSVPIKENQPFISQYIHADQLTCRDIDLSYHISKVMAEQVIAWYGLNKKIQTISLRFGPIDKVFLGTSVSNNNATQAIILALQSKKEFWYEPYSIVDEQANHINITKAKTDLGYNPADPKYSAEQIHSTLGNSTQINP